VLLVDPPFEEAGEWERLVAGLVKAHMRWPGGVYALWYPIKDRRAVEAFRKRLGETGIPKMIDIRFDIRAASPEPRFDGSGLVVVNPPFPLESELSVVLPVLLSVLREGPGASATVVSLAR
jgi:23S rRNA (adenine2030-N6)-methyltransferase